MNKVYKIIFSNRFKKQYRNVLKQGKVTHDYVISIADKLANKEALPDSFCFHKLHGVYEGAYEVHLKPDVLLVFSYYNDILVLELLRIGSHSDLFN